MKSYIITEPMLQSVINCIFAAHHPGVSLTTINGFVQQLQGLPAVEEEPKDAEAQ